MLVLRRESIGLRRFTSTSSILQKYTEMIFSRKESENPCTSDGVLDFSDFNDDKGYKGIPKTQAGK